MIGRIETILFSEACRVLSSIGSLRLWVIFTEAERIGAWRVRLGGQADKEERHDTERH